VVALAHQYEPIPTFTGYYEHDGCDERHYANLVAKSNHTEILITPQDFIDNFDEMLRHIRPPYQGMGTFGQYMVGKFIADNTDLKVILSGEGSDELFGGYARLLIVAGEEPPVGYEMYKVPDDYPRNVAAALALDFYRLNDLLAVDDQCMAAHGLEARAPFTDREVVEYVLCQPAHERVGSGC
jgi:asparagine synthetase B (glutamine-hydrolysing)